MKAFMDQDFLLSDRNSKAAVPRGCLRLPDHRLSLPHRSAAKSSRIDGTTTITQVWLGGDHYKWRLMRCAGVSGGIYHGRRERL